MAKVNTHVLIDEELRDLAKARNISMSRTLNDALSARLALPNTKEELIVQAHKLGQELEAIKAKEAELDKTEEVKTRRKVIEEMQADVKELRELWAKHLEGGISDADWYKYVSKFCETWKVERAVAVQYAEGQKEVI